jgi:hypothetical protein
MRALWATLKSLLQTLKDRYLTRQTPKYHPESDVVVIDIRDSTLVQTQIDFSLEKVI